MAEQTAAEGEWLLAIDSSTEEAGVALSDGRRSAEINWTASRDQTVTVLDQIDRMLGLMQIEPRALSLVAIATGPGMFNGLRVGLGIAKGLVLGLDVPLLGVSTLEATALPHAAGNLPVVPVVAAGRGRLVWAIYEASATGDLRGIGEPRNGFVQDLAAQIDETGREVIVCGELTQEQVGILGAVSTVRLPAEAIRGRRAAAVLELARVRHTRGEEDDPITLEPLYLHAARMAG